MAEACVEEQKSASMGDLELWRQILACCAPFKAALALAAGLALASSIAALFAPRLIQEAVDKVILAANIDPLPRLSGLRRFALFYAGLALISFVCVFAQTVLLEWVGQSVMHHMRQKLCQHMLGLDLAFFHSQPLGRLVTRLTNDIQNMHEMMTSVLVVLFNEGLKLVGVFGFLFWMNKKLALLMFLFVPAAALATWLFSRLSREAFRDLRAQLARINSFLAERLRGMTLIQVFSAQARSRADFCALNNGYARYAFRQIRVFGIFHPLIAFFPMLAVALLIWYGGGEALRGRLTIGELIAFLTYMHLFFQPLREIAQNYSLVQQAMASAERIFATLEIKPSILSLADNAAETPKKTGPESGPALSLQGVFFAYQPGQPVLKDISLDIQPEETVALIGATGAGKTSLASLLVRFYDPLAGKILLNGQDLRAFPLNTLRRKIGLVMQDIFILPDTVLANIILELPYEEERLARLLEQTGLSRFTSKLPAGLNTLIGEGGRGLSSGERQLLAFARALYREPEILLLDEATASIDAWSETLLEEALAASSQGRASLVIAHRLATIRRAGRIAVMEHGRIIEIGTPAELLARSSRYRDMLRLDNEELPPHAGGTQEN